MLATLGKRFHGIWRSSRSSVDLLPVVDELSALPAPIIIVSSSGNDQVSSVEHVAKQRMCTVHQVSMGSPEGFVSALDLLTACAKSGEWLVLRNVHLCTHWLRDTLENRLAGIIRDAAAGMGEAVHKGFRIFLTSETNPDLPTTLLRDAEVIVVEKSVGVKASMEQFCGANEDKILPPMVEQRKRLLQMLARLHASIQERSRYQGWSKPLRVYRGRCRLRHDCHQFLVGRPSC